MIFDPLYLLIVGVGLVLGFLASAKVKSTAAYYSRIGTRRGYTGAQVAERQCDRYRCCRASRRYRTQRRYRAG